MVLVVSCTALSCGVHVRFRFLLLLRSSSSNTIVVVAYSVRSTECRQFYLVVRSRSSWILSMSCQYYQTDCRITEEMEVSLCLQI